MGFLQEDVIEGFVCTELCVPMKRYEYNLSAYLLHRARLGYIPFRQSIESATDLSAR